MNHYIHVCILVLSPSLSHRIIANSQAKCRLDGTGLLELNREKGPSRGDSPQVDCCDRIVEQGGPGDGGIEAVLLVIDGRPRDREGVLEGWGQEMRILLGWELLRVWRYFFPSSATVV